MIDPSPRYVFTCPTCASSFSISLDRIPPVQARFSCPKCGKGMDFPSREEARVYIQLQTGEVIPTTAPAPPPPPPPEPPPPAELKPAPPVPPIVLAPVAAKAEPPPPPDPAAEKRFVVERPGFEGDSYDRRAMRNLIRTGALNEFDQVRVGDGAPTRAADLPELKSLFELRKTARTSPPAVCRKHTEVVAHYECADTRRPLCEECAPEKKFGGTTVRMCEHCGGTSRELHAAPNDLP